MKSRLLPIVAIYLLIDIYCFFGFKTVFHSENQLLLFTLVYVLLSIITLHAFRRLDRRILDLSIFQAPSINNYLAIIALSFISKIIFVLGLIILDIITMILGLIKSSGSEPFEFARSINSIWFLLGITLLTFVIVLYGLTLGKYNYHVNKMSLEFDDLPAGFENFRLVQISDIHAGSYDNSSKVKKAVELINLQEADVILFTGDLINDHKDEIDPYINIFKELKAKHGVYAVLGNHDYYAAYREQHKEKYWKDFAEKFKLMNWVLLNNRSIEIKKKSQVIKIVGVENWGASRWFPKRGNLDEALKDCKPNDFCILMSHDPTHWEHQIKEHPQNIQLTLSGHTHGFQFGINMLGIKWSPAKYNYPKWMGLYQEGGRSLYVNKGLGFLAFPGRIGMRPEITVIDLKHKSS